MAPWSWRFHRSRARGPRCRRRRAPPSAPGSTPSPSDHEASNQKPQLIHELDRLFPAPGAIVPPRSGRWASSQRGFPIKEPTRDLLPSDAFATRIRFSCGFLPLPEPHFGLVFGNVTRRTWVEASPSERPGPNSLKSLPQTTRRGILPQAKKK